MDLSWFSVFQINFFFLIWWVLLLQNLECFVAKLVKICSESTIWGKDEMWQFTNGYLTEKITIQLSLNVVYISNSNLDILTTFLCIKFLIIRPLIYLVSRIIPWNTWLHGKRMFIVSISFNPIAKLYMYIYEHEYSIL